MSLLSDPLVVDTVTVSHEFERDVSLPIPITEEVCAEHARRLAHWATLAVKASAWHARVARELALMRVSLMAKTVGQADALTAMAASAAARGGATKVPKGPTIHKWKVEAQAETDPTYLAKAAELAAAEEAKSKLAEWVAALRERGRMIDNMVRIAAPQRDRERDRERERTHG